MPRNREEADLFFCSVYLSQKCETRTKIVRGAKADQVERAEFQIPAQPFLTPLKSTFAAALNRNRLRLLVEAVEEAQRDPYRRKPTTLSMLRGALIEAYRYMHDNGRTATSSSVPGSSCSGSCSFVEIISG